MDNFQKKFIEEASDLIDRLEKVLLSIGKDNFDPNLIDEIFRIMHSLKGGGAMFGFTEISEITHDLESLYDKIRLENSPISNSLLNITLKSVDHLRNLLNINQANQTDIKENHESLKFLLSQEFSEKHENSLTKNNYLIPNTENNKDSKNSFLIYFSPCPEIFSDGTNPLYLVDELVKLGDTIILVQTQKIPNIDDISSDLCYVAWHIILSTNNSEEMINDVFIFLNKDCEAEIIKICAFDILKEDKIRNEIKELNKNPINKKEIELLLKNITPEYKKEEKVLAKMKSFKKEASILNIRVASEKIDLLMNMVSELVTTQASLGLYAENKKENKLLQISENIENLTRQLRDITFSISLIPIEHITTRFQRLVRDLSASFDKNIDLQIEGAETKLDKTLIEGLTEPLMHLIRNNIDHGIESPKERMKKNKPEQGKIYIRAYYSGVNVVIEIEDDGRGIMLDLVHKKAIEKGFIHASDVLSDKEILDLVFIPGFSTAQKVTDISGRGVGLDVVKQKIGAIRGEIEIESKPGIGTKVRIKLPITLSIIDGMLVSIDDENYIIPLNVVNKIHAIERSKLKKAYNNIITVDGDQVPFYDLRDEFEMDNDGPEISELVIVKYEDKRIGLVVDTVIGEYQAVLKSLGRLYRKQEIISGASILGDGTIALVLDSNKIINKFSSY